MIGDELLVSNGGDGTMYANSSVPCVRADHINQLLFERLYISKTISKYF